MESFSYPDYRSVDLYSTRTIWRMNGIFVQLARSWFCFLSSSCIKQMNRKFRCFRTYSFPENGRSCCWWGISTCCFHCLFFLCWLLNLDSFVSALLGEIHLLSWLCYPSIPLLYTLIRWVEQRHRSDDSNSPYLILNLETAPTQSLLSTTKTRTSLRACCFLETIPVNQTRILSASCWPYFI